MTARVVSKRSGDPYDVYIGRPSQFGNPCAVGKKCPECGDVHRVGGSTLACYETYLRRRLMEDPEFAKAVESLRGKVLCCWCKPAPCHGDLLLEIANHRELGGKA